MSREEIQGIRSILNSPEWQRYTKEREQDRRRRVFEQVALALIGTPDYDLSLLERHSEQLSERIIIASDAFAIKESK